jgi:hypothetical protein
LHDFFSLPSLCSPLSPLFSIDGLDSLLILKTGLGLPVENGLGGVVVGNGFGFADLGLGLLRFW